MNFTADTYFSTYTSKILIEAIRETRRMTILLFINPDDYVEIIGQLKFYIENKRISSGVGRNDYKINTLTYSQLDRYLVRLYV